MKEQELVRGPGVSGSDIAEIKARYEAATGGPWKLDVRWPDDVLSYGGNTVCRLKHPFDDMMLEGNVANDKDFIAYARTDIPALVEALEEAQGKLDAVEEWNKSFGGTVLYEHLARILKGD